MAELTRQQRLSILYNLYDKPTESGGRIYQLSTSRDGSGMTFGVNQIDLSRTPIAGTLIAAINQYADANPDKMLARLSYAPEDLAAPLTEQNKSTLAAIAAHPTIAAFFASDTGRRWVDHQTGQRVGSDLDTVSRDLGSGPIARQILNDPMMLALVMEVNNNHGNCG
jgi:hypothetical protein